MILPGGTVLCLFPMGPVVGRAETCGLRWPLDGLQFDRSTASLSNQTCDTTVEITVQSGAFMLVRHRADRDDISAFQ